MFEKVYIIDDEVSVFLIQAMLAAENFAHTYETFLTPRKALAQLLFLLQERQLAELPEVIFLDLNMPEIDGWRFLERIAPHADLLRRHCLVYILTSSVDSLELRQAKAYNFISGCLHKPLEEGTIQSILRRAS